MSKNLVLILAILFANVGFSQIFKSQSPDTVKAKLLVVPFMPKIYINDVEKQIYEQTGKTHEQIVNLLRIELDRSITNALKDTSDVLSLLSSQTANANDELELLYASSNYFLDNAMSFDKKRNNTYAHSKTEASKKEAKKIEKQKAAHKGEVVSVITDNSNKFLNVRISETNLIPDILKNHDSDFLLYLTQFEISSSFAEAQKSMLKIHYSLFKRNGEFYFGTFAIIESETNEFTLEKICKELIPQIAREITKQIPYKVK